MSKPESRTLNYLYYGYAVRKEFDTKVDGLSIDYVYPGCNGQIQQQKGMRGLISKKKLKRSGVSITRWRSASSNITQWLSISGITVAFRQ